MQHAALQRILVFTAFWLPIAGCYRPYTASELRQAGVPERHIVPHHCPAPFSKDLFFRLAPGPAEEEEDVPVTDRTAHRRCQYSSSSSGSSRGGGGGGGGSLRCDIGGGDGEAALILLAVFAVVILVCVIIAIPEVRQTIGKGIHYMAASAGYVVYSVTAGPVMIASTCVRGVLVDAPSEVGRWLRSDQENVRRDLKQLIALWNGPPLRGIPPLAIRSSGEAILYYSGRLEETTGKQFGVAPWRWITYYRNHYGRWNGPRPIHDVYSYRP